MRYLLIIPLILLAGSPVRAQETESRMQKIMHPDKNAASNLQDKSFYGGKTFNQTTSPAYTKNFYFTEHYSPKDYSTKSYYGVTPYSTGKFETHGANTKGNYEIPNASKKADSKTFETKESSSSGKSYSISGYQTREFRDKGKSQALFDQQKKEEKPMTVDQVRDLLNKSK